VADSKNIVEIIDQQKVSWFQIRILVLGILAVFLDGFDNQSIGFVAPALKAAWHLHGGALGPVFSAGVFGLALGGLTIGPYGDRFGRARILLLTVIFTGIMALLMGQVTNITELMVARFLIGLGLGAVMPICIVLINEYAPNSHRATMVTLVICGYSLGAASGGFLASHLVPVFGWQSAFYVGGAATLVLAVALRIWMPESIRYLALKPDAGPRIAAILRKINPALSFASDVRFTTAKGGEAPDSTSSFEKFMELFARHRRAVTFLLWISMFMDYIVLNFLNNWLPSLVTDTGLPGPLALRAATALQFGGFIGILSMGVLADRFGYYRVITVAFGLGGVFIAGIGLVGSSLFGLIPTIFIAGIGAIGCNLALGALSATLYPTRIRSTGSGWAFGAARLLSIVGPLLGGFVISLHWSLRDIFLVVSLPMFLGAVSVAFMSSIAKGQPELQAKTTARAEWLA
jgi:AAHS family 4-hydroxybenzoate transporter-like MFS transporter